MTKKHKFQVPLEQVRKAIEEKYGIRAGYLAAAAADLGVNYTQLSSALAGRVNMPQHVLEKLKLIPTLPRYTTADGFTGEVLVISAPQEVRALLTYLRAWPGGRFTTHENHYLSQCLLHGLQHIKEQMAANPWNGASEAEQANLQRLYSEANAPVASGNADIEDGETDYDPLA